MWGRFDKATASEIAIAMVFCVAVLVVYSLVMYLNLRARYLLLRSREEKSAPRKPPLAILVLEVAGAAQLWEWDEETMLQATESFTDVVRQLVFAQGAYEAKRFSNSFMIACHTAEEAVVLANDIQRAMMDVPWPETMDLNTTPYFCRPFQSLLDGLWLYRGLRVKVGIEVGSPAIYFDRVTTTWEYFGHDVERAKHLCRVARAGESYITSAVYDSLPAEVKREFAFIGVGTVALGDDEIELLSTLPLDLEQRHHQEDSPSDRKVMPDEPEVDKVRR